MLNFFKGLNLNGSERRQKLFLAAAIALLAIISSAFLIVIPLLHSIRTNEQAIKNQKAILNYVLKYSSKIKALKSLNEAAIPPDYGTSLSAGVKSNPKSGHGSETEAAAKASSGIVRKGYMKFISSLFQYFKIGKSRVSKFYSRYSSSSDAGAHNTAEKGKGDNAGGGQAKENIFISLKGLSLNQCVNLIYAISRSAGGYGANIISIKMKKNFGNGKLLNLTLSIARK